MLFLNAVVVSKAARVVGTPCNTFGRFVQDVLWRMKHGWASGNEAVAEGCDLAREKVA